MILRKVFKNWDECKTTADELKSIINENFSNTKLYKGFVDSILGFDSSFIQPPDEVVMEFE
jgi:hypothetical protein